MAVHYLEIVSTDVDTLTALYQRMHGLSFGLFRGPPETRQFPNRQPIFSASATRMPSGPRT